MATVKRLPVDLTDAQIDEFGREIDLIYDEAIASRGAKDRQYILRIIRTQRSMALGGRILMYIGLFFLPAWPHAFASWSVSLTIIGLGALSLGFAKILENMEI
ncbi:MAG: hypothetical protein Q8K94_01850, partial [Moraxellaceae bacterium]|nr:hypothetical protein [Moraxellaceae bacterium]